MILARIRQGITYIFGKYDFRWDSEVKEELSEKEFEIFSRMGRYDRIHSYKLFKKIEKDSLLSDDIKYRKLSLLHDCGKESVGLLRRVKKVLLGDKKLSSHTELGYFKIKELDEELAALVRKHHSIGTEEKIRRFQELDDR